MANVILVLQRLYLLILVGFFLAVPVSLFNDYDEWMYKVSKIEKDNEWVDDYLKNPPTLSAPSASEPNHYDEFVKNEVKNNPDVYLTKSETPKFAPSNFALVFLWLVIFGVSVHSAIFLFSGKLMSPAAIIRPVVPKLKA